MLEEPSAFSGARGAMLGACADMGRMLAGLNDSHGRVAEEIHQLRKAGKRLRGALMLAGEPKPCIRWIAVIGRMLGGSRDAAARAKTWQGLSPETQPEGSAEAAISGLLEQEAHAAARRPPQALIEWSHAALGQIQARLEARTDADVAESAEAGAAKLHRQLRKRLRRALERVRNEDFHDCRKTAKAWLGGLALAAPGHVPAGTAETERLADALGEENDLEVLADWLVRRGFSQSICPATWKVLRKRQEKIRRQSISLIRKELLPALKKMG